jgi:hypothetical protein
VPEQPTTRSAPSTTSTAQATTPAPTSTPRVKADKIKPKRTTVAPTRVKAPQSSEDALRDRIVDIAVKQINTKVNIVGGLHTGKVRDYFNATDIFGKQGILPKSIVEWQGYFTTWVRKEAGRPVGDGGGGGELIDDVINWARANNQWQPKRAGFIPEAGDIVTFKTDLSLGRTANFTGVVTRVENGRVHTIEGNIYLPTGGIGVGRRSHALNDPAVSGYITAVPRGNG